MIISLLFFLITFSVDKKTNIITKETNLESSNTNNKLFPLKDNVDFCLEKNLRRALIIAGARGGFIYDNSGRYTTKTFIPDNTYNDFLIINLDLNWNNLLSKTLVYYSDTTTAPYPPEDLLKKNNAKIFNSSIKEDFEKFMLNEFINCIDLEEYINDGYNISYEKFSGFIKEIKLGNKIIVEKLEGRVNDTIEFTIEDKLYKGKITKIIDDDLVEIEVTNSNLDIKSNQNIQDVKVINLNSTMSVDVIFEDEKVKAKLNFPIKISKGTFETSYEQSIVSSNVRFRKLLKIAEKLTREKEKNKTLDYSNSMDLSYALKDDVYLANTDLKGFRIVKNYINSTDEDKKIVYSIVDDESRILGSPYIFNFAYYNSAPFLNLSEIADEIYENEGIAFIVALNNQINVNMSDYIYEKQLIDLYTTYFLSENHIGKDAIFSLTPKGQMSFVAHQKKKYNYEITVTDGETQSKENLIFLVGFPDNTNNKAASDCFEIKHFQTSTYPVELEFRNKIFRYGQANQKDTVFSYILNVPTNVFDKPKEAIVKFKKSCQFNQDLYPLTVKLNGKPIATSLFDKDKNEITIPFSKNAQKLQVEVRDKSGNLMTEAYELNLYPAKCLGPYGISDYNISKSLGGTGSCCDTGSVTSAINSKTPTALDNIKTSGFAVNTNVYLCTDVFLERGSTIYAGDIINPQEESLWAKGGSDITSLFNANIKISCDGTSPKGSKISVSPIPSETHDGTKTLNIAGTTLLPFDSPKSFRVGITHKNGVCELCTFTHNLFNAYSVEGIPFKVGLINENNKLGKFLYYGAFSSSLNQLRSSLKPIESYYFRKDTNKYVKTSSTTNWVSREISKGGNKDSRISESNLYCGLDSASSSRYKETSHKSDNNPECTDWYFNGVSFESQPNTGWLCSGTYVSSWKPPSSCTPGTTVSPQEVISPKKCDNGVCSGKSVPNPGLITCP